MISCRYLIEKIFSLISVFVLIAFYLLLNGFEFIPLIILIVYVGTIAVLFLFVVIIVNPDFSDILQEMDLLKTLWLEQLLMDQNILDIDDFKKTLVSVDNLFFKRFQNKENKYHDVYDILKLWFYYIMWGYYSIYNYLLGFNTAWGVHYSISKMYTFPIIDSIYHPIPKILNIQYIYSDLYYIANSLYTTYGFMFLIMGFILFIAIIGVIMLGLKKSLYVKRQNMSEQFFRYR